MCKDTAGSLPIMVDKAPLNLCIVKASTLPSGSSRTKTKQPGDKASIYLENSSSFTKHSKSNPLYLEIISYLNICIFFVFITLLVMYGKTFKTPS